MSNNGTPPCEICGGLGVVTLDVPVGHPDFGKAFPCICQADKVKARKATQLRSISNLDAYADKTFATFEIDHSLLEEHERGLAQTFPNMDNSNRHDLTEEQRRYIKIAAETALNYADNPQGWLLFQGGYGTGKTHLALAIANRRIDRGEPVLFITVPDLLDHLRAAFGPSSEVDYDERFEQLRTAPLLILDDLGAESQTSWAQEKLYQLISHRHAAKLPTVVTTNRDPETLDPRIRSRLTDQALTQNVRLIVPDWRSSITTWQELDLSNLDRYRDMRFDTFDMRQSENLPASESKRLEQAVQMARHFAESPQGWLVLTGPAGCGKTHLAAAIAHECKRRGLQTLFVTTSELLDHLRATFHPGSTVSYDRRMEEIRRATILVLDSLNIERNLSSWARDKLFDILLYRFDYDLPTVITTYQPLDEMDMRLRSRVKNESHSAVVAITAPGYPGKTPKRRAAPPRRQG
jgi:DNA replication protein DnaC